MDDFLQLEVDELTEMLRADPLFSRFRAWLEDRGFDVTTTLLAGLIEHADGVVPGGDGKSIGVVVVPPGRVFEFEGNIFDAPGAADFRWEEVSLRQAADRWPTLNAIRPR